MKWNCFEWYEMKWSEITANIVQWWESWHFKGSCKRDEIRESIGYDLAEERKREKESKGGLLWLSVDMNMTRGGVGCLAIKGMRQIECDWQNLIKQLIQVRICIYLHVGVRRRWEDERLFIYFLFLIFYLYDIYLFDIEYGKWKQIDFRHGFNQSTILRNSA